VFTDKGGLVVSAADLLGSSTPPESLTHSASDNGVIVRLWDCEIAGNYSVEVVNNVTIEHFDFEAFGARSDLVPPSNDLAGTDNHVLIQLRGTTAAVDVVEHDSVSSDGLLTDPNGNEVTIVRIPTRKPHQ
jgi:hypothetical protein